MKNNNTKIIFATNNLHKLEEARCKLRDIQADVELLSLQEMDFHEEIPETQNSLKGNALQKAEVIFQRFGMPCMADDTGLEIKALDGRPGVFSARYAGENCSFQDNMRKVLHEMEGVEQREASFVTVIAYMDGKDTRFFEGRSEGEILVHAQGEKGFGYDPIFRPKGYDKSFAEIPLQEKNTISHRARALQKWIDYLHEK